MRPDVSALLKGIIFYSWQWCDWYECIMFPHKLSVNRKNPLKDGSFCPEIRGQFPFLLPLAAPVARQHFPVSGLGTMLILWGTEWQRSFFLRRAGTRVLTYRCCHVFGCSCGWIDMEYSSHGCRAAETSMPAMPLWVTRKCVCALTCVFLDLHFNLFQGHK